MIKELFLYRKINGVVSNYTALDIDKMEIVRNYISPYFSDVTKLNQNGTYTVQLPMTTLNRAFFEEMHREDMSTDVPYTIIYADYFINGLPIFTGAETKVLSVSDNYEVQFVWGLNRVKYSPLFTNKLNEITVNESTITSDEWIYKDVFYPAPSESKYTICDYVSVLRKSDIEIIDGAAQPQIQPPAPFNNGVAKAITLHPFISAANILDLIYDYMNISTTEISALKAKLKDKGLLLSGNKDNNVYSYTYLYNGTNETSSKLPLSYGGSDDYLLRVTRDTFKLQPGSIIDFEVTVNIKLDLRISVSAITGMQLWKKEIPTGTETKIQDVDCRVSDYETTCNTSLSLLVEKGFEYCIKFTGYVPASNTVLSGSKINITSTLINSVFSSERINCRYNCLINLPDCLLIEFIQQLLIHVCGFFGYDTNGNLKTYFLDDFVLNKNTGNIYTWKVSNIQKGYFQFNSNAQKNYIKFSNDKDLINRKETITVSDQTIQTEKDLYTLQFDSPVGKENEKSEFILYEQSVKKGSTEGSVQFENKYVGDKYKPAFVKKDSGVLKNINVVYNYDIYKKLINRPIIKEVEVNLDFFDSANIDFTKPVYVEEWGKYCMILEVNAPDDEVCTAKLLLINQEL